MTRATRKGVSPLDRGSQVHPMGEFQNLLDFPPAPKLNILGRLDPAKASEAEKRGEALFFGKAQCSTCHPAPYYTDNLMHNLQTERFFKEVTINGRKASADGPIKTFPLRGIRRFRTGASDTRPPAGRRAGHTGLPARPGPRACRSRRPARRPGPR